MPALILGTAGHIDHGKTALVRALTGIDTDRLPEEKQRGITIDIGFANLTLDDGTEIGIVDVPGHEAFVRNMLAGATGIDLALLIVAADEGVMPQTREHLAILELLGVRALLVVLTKCDLVTDDWLELVREDVTSLLEPTTFHDSPTLTTSVMTGQGLDPLVASIAQAARALPSRDENDAFRLPIDRIFTVRGTGTVVTGTVWSGLVRTDATLRLLPAGERVRVRGIQTHGRDKDRARAGERAALALAGTARTDVRRGDCLVEGDAWDAARIVTVRLRALATASPMRTRQRVRFHLGTTEILGRVALLQTGPLAPRHEGWAQIRLESPIVARAGDRFVLRSFSPVTTIAGGRVVEPQAPKRKRISDSVLACFRSLLDDEPPLALDAAARLAAFSGLPIDRIPILIPLLPGTDYSSAAFLHAAGRLFHADVSSLARASFLAAITSFHENKPLAAGIPRETLRQTLPPHAPPALADAMIDELIRAGLVVAEAHTIRLASFRATLQPGEQAAADALERLFLEAGLAAPGRDEIPPPYSSRTDLDDLLHFLLRAGRLVPIADGRFLHPLALASAIALARKNLAGRDDLSPADFRDLFGISRKYLIPLLEHLDRAGVTRRSGERRRVEPSVPGSHTAT
ncbi:MAG: selenocysteine-specific translation elongation factor [Longimicrobiales bacterium]